MSEYLRDRIELLEEIEKLERKIEKQKETILHLDDCVEDNGKAVEEFEKQNESLKDLLKEYIKRIESITSDTEDVKYIHACASMDLYHKLKER